MQFRKFTAEEHNRYGYTHEITVSYTDLNDTAGLTKTLNIFPGSGNAAAGLLIRKSATKVITAFVGCTTLAVEIGDGSDPNRIQVSTDMKATAGTWFGGIPSTAPFAFTSADTLDALFTATSENLNQLTAGEVKILVDLAPMNELYTKG